MTYDHGVLPATQKGNKNDQKGNKTVVVLFPLIFGNYRLAGLSMRSIILNSQPVQVAAPMVTRSRVPVVMCRSFLPS